MDLSDLPVKQRIATAMLVFIFVLVVALGIAIEQGKKEKLKVDRAAAGGMYDRTLENTPPWKLSFTPGTPPGVRFKGQIDRITPAQRAVAVEGKPEEKGTGAYVNHRETGLYVDVVSGEPLFASTDRLESDSGWAVFAKPVAPQFIVQKPGKVDGADVTELRSREAGSLFGRLVPDPADPMRQVYRAYSGALRFIPSEGLKAEGYSEYVELFGKK